MPVMDSYGGRSRRRAKILRARKLSCVHLKVYGAAARTWTGDKMIRYGRGIIGSSDDMDFKCFILEFLKPNIIANEKAYL